MQIQRTNGYKISTGKLFASRLEAVQEEGKVTILKDLRANGPGQWTTEQVASFIMNKLPDLAKINQVINAEVGRAKAVQTHKANANKVKVVATKSKKVKLL